MFLQGFEPLYNHQLLPPTFQRDQKLLPPGSEVSQFFTTVLKELKLLTKLVNFSSYQQFLDFFRDMSNLSPTLLSRSLAFIIYLPSNRKVLGKHIMGNTVVEAVSEFIGFKERYMLS